ncbi:MAG: multi-sensor signal transduction histidine [Geobacteraceae bacterium]|nr:MAG: multi-sensor signal transduction histidine [Geobacteraceae bacterium]
MNHTFWVASLGVGYLLGLFAIAYATDKARERGRSPVDNPWVYSFSLAVYCTSWTYYGSVGQAATTGLGFLPIYLGPTLVFLLAPSLLRRLVSFCRAEGVTSLPDLLEVRYGRGWTLGALATTLMVIGITPYIGLQLKAVGYTFDLLTGRGVATGILDDASFWAALGLSIFAGLFGARSLVATERHEGMVAAVAFESAVKLGAFLVIGFYITFAIGGGFTEVFQRALADADLSRLFLLGEGSGTSLPSWVALSVLSASAVILLPRQFHMLAVENVRERHLRTTSWAFPAYLLLINVLVLPVALVGRLDGEGLSPDFFMISLPLSRGHTGLAFLAYLGGFSAATGMVIVEAVALATMILHHSGVAVLSGVYSTFRGKGVDLSRPLLYTKRAVIFGVVLLGYGFKRWIGESHTLVATGLLSFSAVIQFAPAVLFGLYWKRGTRTGALAGLAAGFGVWIYTLLIPSFVDSGWMSESLLTQGPWGMELLRPRALFGLHGFDTWTHALIWSLVFNMGAYFTFSLLTPQPAEEAPRVELPAAWATRADLEGLLARFVGAKTARDVLGSLPERSSPQALLEATERCLASALGAPSARMIINSTLAWPRDRAVEILDVFGGVSQTLAESREALERRLRELVVLHEASHALSRSLDIETLLQEVLLLIKREFGFEHLAVRLLDEDGILRIRSYVGLMADYVTASAMVPSRDTYFGLCFLDARPVVVGDTREIDKPLLFSKLVKDVPVSAFIHAPMTYEGRVIGVLTAYATRGPMHFTDEFVELFAALANQLAMAAVNAQLYAEVQAYSHAMEEKVARRTAELEKANARLLELDRLKSDFLSTVSHELRTPLTSIQSFSEILLRYDVDDAEKRKKFVGVIHTEAERLTRMINDLLDLSKIEAGRLELYPRPLELEPVFAKALNSTHPLFAEKEIKVVSEVEAGIPPVYADADCLHQVLTNLLSNAVKFSPTGGEVRLSGRQKDGFALIVVADEGPGIPSDRLEQVFDRFHQLRDPQKSHPLGTGLGLTISREIVERMGGKIWVESELGAGAVFSFTVPLSEAPHGLE